jgi:hypothetical protein
MKKIVMVLIIGLIALAFIVPASAAGNKGDGKGYGMQVNNGAGQANISGECPNPDCPHEYGMGNSAPPRDGTGSGKMYQPASGQNRTKGECMNPDCLGNCTGNATPPGDGTGFQYRKASN